jgi:hypothetical protein
MLVVAVVLGVEVAASRDRDTVEQHVDRSTGAGRAGDRERRARGPHDRLSRARDIHHVRGGVGAQRDRGERNCDCRNEGEEDPGYQDSGVVIHGSLVGGSRN